MKDVKSWIHRLTDRTTEFALDLIEEALWNDALRATAVRQIERRVLSEMEGETASGVLPQVAADRADMITALLESVKRALDRKVMSRRALSGALRIFNNISFLQDRQARAAARRYEERHGGLTPPGTIVVSPTRACNLRCPGCYANAEAAGGRLERDILNRILSEAQSLWALRFITISGGEPLVYRSQGRDLLDVLADHPQCYFMIYTNGTLIDEKTAARMVEAGNMTPAISVEGFERRTDERRGPGVYRRILRAMEALRREGVPFGISLTATRQNAEELLSDEFIDFFFDQQMATYGWIFQYMPIGRSRNLDLLPSPEQRLWMWRRTWEIVRQRKIMLADFWNCGTVTLGCISAARPSGYLYINWDGKVMPCVFVPYAAADLREIYQRGGTLDDVVDVPYFQAIRQWQRRYEASGGPGGGPGNWLLPCPLRDHYETARALIEEHRPEPESEPAREAYEDGAFAEAMSNYDQALRETLDPAWEAEYLCCAAGKR